MRSRWDESPARAFENETQKFKELLKNNQLGKNFFPWVIIEFNSKNVSLKEKYLELVLIKRKTDSSFLNSSQKGEKSYCEELWVIDVE